MVTIGLLLVVAGTLLPILRLGGDTWKYIYTAGAVITLIGRLITPVKKELPLRLRKLIRLETWSALFFCVAAFFIFYTPLESNWVPLTLCGGVVQVYTSVMIPRVARKEKL